MTAIDWKRTDKLIELALEEDLGSAGDTTTLAVVPPWRMAQGSFICKEKEMVLAGLEVAARVFAKLDKTVEFFPKKKDGEVVRQGEIFATVVGKAQILLTGERTALNFLQRLSGIATTAARYASLARQGGDLQILDTRKTTPGFRNLEKYAVATGGAGNHRTGLFDRILIKDNHREMALLDGDDGITEAVAKARKKYPELEIEVEVDTLEQFKLALAAGADYILLDNMDDKTISEAVKLNAGQAKLEASGNITGERITSLARIGVDYASAGALTHSVKAADISLDISALEI